MQDTETDLTSPGEHYLAGNGVAICSLPTHIKKGTEEAVLRTGPAEDWQVLRVLMRTDLRSNDLTRDNQLHTAILLAALSGLIAGNRHGFSKSLRR